VDAETEENAVDAETEENAVVAVNTETEENLVVEVNVTVNRTKAHRMGDNYLSSCPVYSQGKGFRMWKQEVQAWVICVEAPENKKSLAVNLAINLPHGHTLKIKERVFDLNECVVLKLNVEVE
jgi:hypothetical protein